MAQSKRLMALVLMSLVATVVPAVYQKGLQPRIEAVNCKIFIVDLKIDEKATQDGIVVFDAYLRIENPSDVEVQLSRLELDVYHHPEQENRYRWIGNLTTDSEYIIPASLYDGQKLVNQGFIQSYLDPVSYYPTSVVNDPYDPEAEIKDYIVGEGKAEGLVVGKLSFYQDVSHGQGTTEAIGNLIERGSLSLTLKGNAKIGVTEFPFEQEIVLAVSMWDKNFMVADVFNYYSKPDTTEKPEYDELSTDLSTDYNVFVVRAKMHNPSTIPMALINYSFDLLDSNGNLVAKGMSVNELSGKAFDPDYLRSAGERYNLQSLYMNGQTMTYLPPKTGLNAEEEWQDIIFIFNFTDPSSPYLPHNPGVKTTENIRWFFNALFQNGIIEGITLRGRFSALIGYFNTQEYKMKGITVDIGGISEETDFRLTDARLHQCPLSKGYNYTNYMKDSKPAKGLLEYISVGNMNVSNINIDSSTNNIEMGVNASILFENPYRLDFAMYNLSTNYFRVGPNENNQSQTFDFASGLSGTPDYPLQIQGASIGNPNLYPFIPGNLDDEKQRDTIYPSVNQIPNLLTLSYNTDDYLDSTSTAGIAKMFQDLGIDPVTLNLTNPLWLLGPEGIMKDGQLDPMILIDYLIKKGIDPLMLLRSLTTSVSHYSGDDAYRPLRTSYFGTNTAPGEDTDPYTISNDFPYGELNPARNFYSPIEIIKGSSWIISLGSYVIQVNKIVENEFFRQDMNNGWTWQGDGTLGNYFSGMILSDVDTNSEFMSSASSSMPPTDSIAWRVYADSNEPYWGYSYDQETYSRGWYIVHSDSPATMMFRQDFTIDTNKIHSMAEIEKATLSIAYRYPNGESSSAGKVGIGYYDATQDLYKYERVDGTTNPGYRLWAGTDLYGYPLTQKGSTETYQYWKHEAVDVTASVRKAYQNYINHGSNDSRWLQMEVAFSTVGMAYMYFDDCVLEIDYTNEEEEPFKLADMFKYIQENDYEEGNAFEFLNNIDFDPVKLTAFMESDLGLNPSGDLSGSDLGQYFQASDMSINRMIQLMEDPELLGSIDAGEPLNFFDMLNYTRYIIDDDPSNNVNTPYGPRTELRPEGWVIEDPYVASRALIQAMKDDMFVNSYGGIDQYLNMYGKELWYLFESLKVELPWVLMYLFMHGWSKDDIFDAMEACGFLKEVKQNYAGSIIPVSHGYIRESMTYESTVYIGGLASIELFPGGIPLSITAEMTDPIDYNYLKLYQYLDAGGSRVLIHSTGPIAPPSVIEMDENFQGTITILIFQFNINGRVEVDMTLDEYEVIVYLENNPGSRIAPMWPGAWNPYLERTNNRGFNDAGAALLTNYLRQEILFNGAPFMELAGDAVGLFDFLDEYMFLSGTHNVGGQQVVSDYSSYTLLEYLDVSSADFIDIICGYDHFNDTFDTNGNGMADDWYAPCGPTSNYKWTNQFTPPMYMYNDDPPVYYPMRGWGADVKQDRIFWGPTDVDYPFDPTLAPTYGQVAPYIPYNGKIIWSDSAQFLDDAFTGRITNPATQHFSSGAPPIVNLIDMLAWLSRTTGKLDPMDFINWLEGRETMDKYIIQDPTEYYELLQGTWDHGIGLQNMWEMLNNANLNVTGMFNWFQNVKGADPYGLLYELNVWNSPAGTNSPDPLDLFSYVQSPNFFRYADGGSGFVYHPAMGSDQSGQNAIAEDNFWQMFNGSWWAENGVTSYWDMNDPENTLPGLIFGLIRDMEVDQYNTGKRAGELTYNYFQMLLNLNVLPDDWLNQIELLGILPLELLGVYDCMNFTKILEQQAKLKKYTRIKINGTFVVSVNGLALSFGSIHLNNFAYYIDPTYIYADDHLANFIQPSLYATDRGTFEISH